MQEFLKGKKTYLQAATAGLVVVGFALGVIDKESAEMMLALCGAGAVASLGAKIDRGNNAN